MPRVTTLTQTKGLRRGLDLKVGAGLNVFRVNKPTRLNKIWERRSGVEDCENYHFFHQRHISYQCHDQQLILILDT